VGSFTPEELRLLALSDAITQWDEDQAEGTRSRDAMAKARAAKAQKRHQERVARLSYLLANRAEIARQRAQERALRRGRPRVLRSPLTWVDRTLLERLPATLLDLEEHLRSMGATKLPRVIEERLQRLVTMGLVVREPIAEGSAGVSGVRWTPMDDPVRKDRCA
jgi:hypothetical protein